MTVANPPKNKYAALTVCSSKFPPEYQSLYRLDYFNCKQWDMCKPTTWGSHYSLRSQVNVYRANGNFYTSIASDKNIVFDAGYGYTKASSVSELTSGSGVRVCGYFLSSV